MTTKKDQARALFMHENLSQADIARLLGVHSKTVYRWIKQDQWERIKKAALNAPALITETAYSLLNKLCTDIDARDEGRGFPTLDEARAMYLVAGTIQRIKARPTIGDHCESISGFMDHVIRKDLALGKILSAEMDEYLLKEAELSQPYKRYELEYHAANYRPVQEDISEEFEDGSSIVDENVKPQQPRARESFMQQMTRKEQEEQLSKEYIDGVVAEYHHNKETAEANNAEDDNIDDWEHYNPNIGEEQQDSTETITGEKKQEIRQALKQLFPNGRWEAAGNLMLRDICTNTHRLITDHEWEQLLNKGYTQSQLTWALG